MGIQPPSELDPALEEVVSLLESLDPDGARAGEVMRRTFDQLYDGGRTGRFRWDQLYKTEKTHFGTLVEINLQREFAFADGKRLDYEIATHEVDAKYSQDLWKWMLPPEAVGELCLVMSASDQRSNFSLGMVRATLERLGAGANRDGKRTLTLVGREAVVWLHKDCPMPPNVLLQLSSADADAIFELSSGQQRVNELFRRAVGRRVSRAAVETVAQQKDPMKRVRANGGARQHLAREGMAILGGDYLWQREVLLELGLPEPAESEFVSTYLAEQARGESTKSVVINGKTWHLATRDSSDPLPRDLYGGTG